MPLSTILAVCVGFLSKLIDEEFLLSRVKVEWAKVPFKAFDQLEFSLIYPLFTIINCFP